MSRIATVFDKLHQYNRKALIPFITAGDPNPPITVTLMNELVKAGADIIELGIPFSDPMADGPTIQRSSERALKHRVGLKDVFNIVSDFRVANTDTPIVLMGYANPVEAMGQDKFSVMAKEAGVDGVLVVDYPPEECAEWVKSLGRHKIDAIFLVSPTTSETRIEKITNMAQGYVYYVSLKGVTGSSNIDLSEVTSKLTQLRSHIRIPIVIGFGIHDVVTAKILADLADGVIVGSWIIEEIEKSTTTEILKNISRLTRDLRNAIDATNI
ncbi:MAG: tryptophan synthase subunit alpha [Nitrosospira sp.]|nr:tryptophan synthase subunit alpha [Nitrosospira sp.]